MLCNYRKIYIYFWIACVVISDCLFHKISNMQRYIYNLAVDVLLVLCLTMFAVENVFLFPKRLHRCHSVARRTQREVYDVVGHDPLASPQLSAISQSTLLGTLSLMQCSITLIILFACSSFSMDILSSSWTCICGMIPSCSYKSTIAFFVWSAADPWINLFNAL